MTNIDQQNSSFVIVLYQFAVIGSIIVPVCSCLKLVVVCSCQTWLIDRDLQDCSFLIVLCQFAVIVPIIIPVYSSLKVVSRCVPVRLFL